MLNDLYDGEVGSIFVSGNYADQYSSLDKYEKIKEEVRAEKAEKKREKAAESGKPIPDSKAAYFYDEEEFGTPDFNYDENNESNSSDPTEEPTENK